MATTGAPPNGDPTAGGLSISPASRLRGAVAIAVPAGLAVGTWFVVLLAVGVIARADSLLDLLPSFFIGLLLWPVVRAAPWREGVTARTRAWAHRNRGALVVAVVLAVLPALPFVPDVVVTVLQLPYRGSGMFFGASLVYREPLGSAASRTLLRFGQWSFHALWLYLLATGLLAIGRRLR